MKLIKKRMYINYTHITYPYYWPQELKSFSSMNLLEEFSPTLTDKIQSFFVGKMMIIMKIMISQPPYRASEIHGLPRIVVALELSFSSYKWVKVENGLASLKLCTTQIHIFNENVKKGDTYINLNNENTNLLFGLYSYPGKNSLVLYNDGKIIDLSLCQRTVSLNVNKLRKIFGFQWLGGTCNNHYAQWKIWSYKR